MWGLQWQNFHGTRKKCLNDCDIKTCEVLAGGTSSNSFFCEQIEGEYKKRKTNAYPPTFRIDP